MAMKMNVWQWGNVTGVDEELCNNLALFAEDNKIDYMNMTEKEFVALKDEYLMKNYGNKGVFSKKSLKERKKFQYGDEIIKFLEKYGYNNRGEDFEQNKDYSTVTYMYAIPHGMRPQTPYVEFTVDADNDAFIFGEYFTDGRKGYSTEFDSVEDLEYFVSNANYSNLDLTESKKSARKNLKESLNSDIKLMVNRIVDDLIGEYTPREWDSLSDNEKFNVIRIKYFMYEGKSKYLSEVRDLVIENMNHPFDVVFESKKSVKKSLKESKASLHEDNVEYGVERIKNKVKGSDVTYYFDDEDCFIDVTEKNGNLWAFTIDFGSGYVYMIEPNEDRGSFGADNEAFDVIISMLQGKRFNEKSSIKESVDGFVATDKECNMSGECWVLDGSYNFIMEFLQEWGIAPKDVKVKNKMTTLYNADGNPFGYVYQDKEVDIFVADKTINWTWKNHNPSTKRVKVIASDEIF